MIPFLNLHKVSQRFEKKFFQGFTSFLDSGYYILGGNVSAFETEFASYCNAKFCVGVGNGLDALRLILEGYIVLGRLNKGDQVLVASNTYIAMKEAGFKNLRNYYGVGNEGAMYPELPIHGEGLAA